MSFSANYPTTAPSLLLDFANSNTVDPRVTFTRASTATYFNSIGSLTTAAINSPRLDYDPTTLASQGLLIEEQRVNSIRNNTGVGAVAGTPGNLPTNWSISGAAGLTTSIVGAGSENGVAYVDIKFAGTSSGTFSAVYFETLSGLTTSTSYTLSTYLKIVGGSATNLSTPNLVTRYNLSPSGSTDISTSFSFGSLTSNLATSRIAGTGTTAGTLTGAGICFLLLNYSSGAAIDITLRIGLPQLEQGAFATSVIPNAPTFTSRASTGTFFDSTGTLQTAAINVARNNYNPASLSTPPLLLIEEARTNSIRNNTMVGAVAGTPGTLPTNWAFFATVTGINREIVGTGTEDGINYIDVRFSGTSSAGTVYDIQFDGASSIAASVGQVWTETFYCKRVAGSTAGVTSSNVRLAFRDGANELSSATTVISPTTSSLRSQRFEASGTAPASTLWALPTLALRFTVGVAVDITLRIGLPQLELGAYPTSVIPTTTVAVTRSADLFTQAAVTRSADVASVNTLTPWYNATEGTLYAQANSISSSYTGGVLVDVGAGGAFGTTEYIAWGGTAWILNPNIAPINVTSSVTTSSTAKVAAGMKLNDSVISANGLIGVTDTSCNIASAPTTLSIGKAGWTAGNYFNGWIQRITYYPIRLSNANLQALTS